jgi:hypothetical protein
MFPPASSRSVDPRLASASGAMRDTLGAIHNLAHLLGSVRVGPKGLARVIPDVQASCNQMVAAIREVVSTTEGAAVGSKAVGEVAQIVEVKMKDLERALGLAKRSSLRAADRLTLERTVRAIARDLDGALEVVELLTEASATGSVPVDVTDFIRESIVRADQGTSRSRRLSVSFDAPESPVIAKMNPRLAMRLFAFGAALAANKSRSVHVAIAATEESCILDVAPTTGAGSTVVISAPRLIEPSADCVAAVAKAAGAKFEREATGIRLVLPRAQPD